MPGPDASPSSPSSTSVPRSSSTSKDDAPSSSTTSPSTAEGSSESPKGPGLSKEGAPEAKVGAAAVEGEKEEEDESEADVGAPSTEEVVDMEVFGQLLEIDDDESHEFSKTLAFDYISQAETTFHEIEDALTAKDLDALSRKGHFLKGSSAALGLQRVQHSCEAMQHFGKRRDAHGEGPEVSEAEALNRCKGLLKRLRKEQQEAKEWLEAFYKEKA
ncbi:Ypd1p [Sporobolomyces salmoneus]|uniref:Ypd1p n=1 Tax=Sporobolomyces salmoneus TaxID=183962 RepID=UPI0031720B1E